MKTVFIQIKDGEEVIWEYEGPLESPKDLKTPVDRPFRCPKHLVYGFIYQPVVKAILGGE
jgi:hypothetical protein